MAKILSEKTLCANTTHEANKTNPDVAARPTKHTTASNNCEKFSLAEMKDLSISKINHSI